MFLGRQFFSEALAEGLDGTSPIFIPLLGEKVAANSESEAPLMNTARSYGIFVFILLGLVNGYSLCIAGISNANKHKFKLS